MGGERRPPKGQNHFRVQVKIFTLRGGWLEFTWFVRLFKSFLRVQSKAFLRAENRVKNAINRLRIDDQKWLCPVGRRPLSEIFQNCARASTVPRRRIDTRINVSDREVSTQHFVHWMSAEGPRVTFLGPKI